MKWALVLALPFASHAGVRPDTITSIVLQGDHIVVSTSLGLQERTSDAKTWSVMPLPPGARPGGCLNKNDVETAQLYYSPPVSSGSEWNSLCMAGHGLWMTADLGHTWTQVDRTHVFSSIFVHRSGVIYAAGRNADGVSDFDGPYVNGGLDLLASRDGGVSWAAVIPEPRFLTLSLLQCAKDPEHVCAIGGDGIGASPIEFAPVPDQWPKFNLWQSDPGVVAKGSDEEYLRPYLSTNNSSPCCYQLRASLENYSQYPFGSKISLPGVRLYTQATQYKFRVGERVSVRAAIELMPVDPPLPLLALPDVDGTEEFWGMKYVDPEGKRGVKPDSPKFHPSDGFSPTVATATAHVLKVGQPYRKEIDLSRLMSFEKPGVYRVQLTFDASPAIKRNNAEWTGFISGEPFTIEIAP